MKAAAGGALRAATPNSTNLAATINGQVLTMATVAALSTDEEHGALVILAGVASTMLVYWMAHAYAEALSVSVTEQRRLPAVELRRVMAREWPVAEAAVPAISALGLTALGAWSVQTGVFITLIGGVLALFGWGLAYGRRRRLAWPRAVMVGVINASFGLVIVALKLLVH
ncbi:MAG: hypothetical protein ACLGI7_10590 [Gammaproteobacteria bacterium]